MNLYFRLVLTILKALLSKQVRCDEKFVWKGRVLPNDIDAYGHMNNGRYITLLGLAAMSAVIRTGLAKSSLKRGYMFIWDQIQARWDRPLKLFEKFTIEVRMLHCEGRYIYATGAFIKANGKVAAQINYRCCLKSRTRESLDVREILKMDGLALPGFAGASPLPQELFVAPGTDIVVRNPVDVVKPLAAAVIENEKRHHQRKTVHIPTLINKMNRTDYIIHWKIRNNLSDFFLFFRKIINFKTKANLHIFREIVTQIFKVFPHYREINLFNAPIDRG